MAIKVGDKIIQGRKVPLIEVDKITRKVKWNKGHGSAHVNLPRLWDGYDVDVTLITPKPFICLGCSEVIRRECEFGKRENYCRLCDLDEDEFEKWKKREDKDKVCRFCKKALSDDEYKLNLGSEECETCWEKHTDIDPYGKFDNKATEVFEKKLKEQKETLKKK